MESSGQGTANTDEESHSTLLEDHVVEGLVLVLFGHLYICIS